MATATDSVFGSVVSLWRYPVKSMMGEELNAARITERGLVGDRAYALLDTATGKVASAKNPRKWPNLFDCRAAFVEPQGAGAELPPVRITLPDGDVVTSDERNSNQVLSKAVGRDVVLETTAPSEPGLEEYWPDMAGLAHRETVTDESLPPGTFFDCAVVHALTTATMNRLSGLYPPGRFEVRRFRPNIVVELVSGEENFVENAWIGHTLSIGGEVWLSVTGLCPRCVMTTLAQGDLPRDPSILRTAAQHNQANVGIYAAVLRGGTVRRGDAIKLL